MLHVSGDEPSKRYADSGNVAGLSVIEEALGGRTNQEMLEDINRTIELAEI